MMINNKHRIGVSVCTCTSLVHCIRELQNSILYVSRKLCFWQNVLLRVHSEWLLFYWFPLISIPMAIEIILEREYLILQFISLPKAILTFYLQFNKSNFYSSIRKNWLKKSIVSNTINQWRLRSLLRKKIQSFHELVIYHHFYGSQRPINQNVDCITSLGQKPATNDTIYADLSSYRRNFHRECSKSFVWTL